MNNWYCEKHKRPYQLFCICGDWRYECPQCRYEGVYDTVAAAQTKMNPANEWTASNKVESREVRTSETERVINDLNVAKHILCNPQILTFEMNIRIGQAITNAITLLKEQKAVDKNAGEWKRR